MQHKSSYYKKSGYSTPLNEKKISVLVDILTLWLMTSNWYDLQIAFFHRAEPFKESQYN